MFSGKTILVAPLDWGLGHATRCVPLIRQLLKNGNKVIIGCTPVNADLFKRYFPTLLQVELPSANLKYSMWLPAWASVMLRVPSLFRLVQLEKKCLAALLVSHQPDVVISDNRYGMFSNQIHSVFVTHQLQIRTPFFKRLVNYMNRHYINCFNEVWVPDFQETKNRLSGELSELKKKLDLPVKYIGPLSALGDSMPVLPELCDCLFLLSGPEPQRTMLETELLKTFNNTNRKCTLVRGKEGVPDHAVSNNIRVIGLADGTLLKSLILGAELIVSRSGYSTLMDLHQLRKQNMVLIPTPGQTEQEYLARYWARRFGAEMCEQHRISDFFRTR